jgi:polyhydroxybutyrate depolymerase
VKTVAITLALLVAASCDGGDNGDEAGGTGQATTSTASVTIVAAEVDPTAKPSPGCDRTKPGLPAGRSVQRTTSEGITRNYQAYVPTSAPSSPRPLVVNLHGHGSAASAQVALSGIEPVAEREDFVTVAPNGLSARFDILGMKDVNYIGQIVDEVGAALCIDLSRVYSMGMSGGGGMSAVLACRSPDRFAAVAPVALVFYIASFCDGTAPTPIVAFMGTADRVVPFEGGQITCCGNPTVRAVPTIMADWAKHNGCEPEPAIEQPGAKNEKRVWQGCDGAADTVLYVVNGGGHSWPPNVGTREVEGKTETVGATEVIWSFFAAHQRN